MSVGANGVNMHVVLDANRRRVRARSVNNVRCVDKRVGAPQIFRGAMHFARVAVWRICVQFSAKHPCTERFRINFLSVRSALSRGATSGCIARQNFFRLNETLTVWNRERVGALVNALT
jgi:hypothetical protein